jgi:hypothetical protein
MKLFGFEIGRKIDGAKPSTDEREGTMKSFAAPYGADDAAVISSSSTSGYYGQVLNIDGVSFNNEKDLILKYRGASTQPECDNAISEIVNGSIISDSDGMPVRLILDNVKLSDSIKTKIHDEFTNLLTLIDFNFNGSDIFRRWYIDGRLYYHKVIDPKKTKDGIKEIRMIDPLRIKKVKEVTTKLDKVTGVKTVDVTSEYYLYTDDIGSLTTSQSPPMMSSGIKIDPEVVTYVPSGLTDETGRVTISYLHKSVKLVNQLRMMEDSLVIYRISRAPERRIFYIDIGNLPKGKAEEYVQGIMAKYRNKLVYDANTGEISDDRKSMSMLEDFWLPRREGGKGTEITTLPGGENLSQIEDVLFFQKKLHRSLNVPQNRLDNESMFNMGRVSEISREEVKFQKFINRLRKKFAILFIDLLRTQLVLKGIITPSDWQSIKENLNVDYVEDNYFSELKDFEILKERIGTVDQLGDKIGKYYSEKWVRSNILNQSDEEIQQMDEEIAEEKAKADAAATPDESEMDAGRPDEEQQDQQPEE